MPRNRDKYATWNSWHTEDNQNVVAQAVDALSCEELVDKMSPDRYRAWNFKPLLDDRGTIESRRPYQTLKLREAQHWVTATLSLIAAFVRNEHLGVLSETDREFRSRLQTEAKKLGLGDYLNHQFFL
jgi:hypothetical protein